MEVMNVPQSRSRISLAPSAVKGMGTKKGMMRKTARKAFEGEGVFDVLKSVGQAVAPVAIDLASDYAKKKLSGGMMMPISLSGGQIRKLKKGGAITIKPEMVSDVAEHALSLLPATAKKVMASLGKDKGMRLALKQGEDLIHRATGKGLFDVLKSVGKVVAPIAIDLASDYAKKKVSGDGVLDVLKSVGKAVAPVAIDLASDYAKKGLTGGKMGMRNRKKSVVGRGGSPYVSMPYKMAMSNYGAEEGGSIYPAGGGLYPAGIRGKGMTTGMGMPIQLGSPYIARDSPAMNPFIPTHSQLSGYNPINNKMKGGEGVIGSTIGQILGSMLPI
jgi:hypothetical protein